MCDCDKKPPLYPVTIAVPMVSANTEYRVDLPPFVEAFSIKTRDASAFRASWLRDTVATPQDPYVTIDVAGEYAEHDLRGPGEGMQLYVATAGAAKTIEGVAWARRPDKEA